MDNNTTTINDLKTAMQAFTAERGWCKVDPKDMALSLMLESAEVLELFQWLSGKEVAENPKMAHALGEELSDVLWWILRLADALNLDIMHAFEQKMAKNGVKYPAAVFTPGMTAEEWSKKYYEIKAATRGGHPLHQAEEATHK